MTAVEPPAGFAARRRAATTLVADEAMIDAFVAAGLDDLDGWNRALACGRVASGRGATAVIEPLPGSAVRLKALRRGGALAPLWRDRFLGTARLLDNLRVPLVATERGVATPRPRALLVVTGPPGLARGFLALDELAGAVDLATRLRGPGDVPDSAIEAAVEALRAMHDAGVEHRDLNLGNLVTIDSAPAVRAAVLDLDGARLHVGPLPADVRARGIVRLERSHLKLRQLGAQGARRLAPETWGERYGRGRPELARAIAARRESAGWSLALRRLVWRRRSVAEPAE